MKIRSAAPTGILLLCFSLVSCSRSTSGGTPSNLTQETAHSASHPSAALAWATGEEDGAQQRSGTDRVLPAGLVLDFDPQTSIAAPPLPLSETLGSMAASDAVAGAGNIAVGEAFASFAIGVATMDTDHDELIMSAGSVLAYGA